MRRGRRGWLWLLLLFLVGCWRPWETPPVVKQVALGDLDGDGALDAAIANGRFGEPYSYPTEIQYQILYNDGHGRFARSARLPDFWNSNFVAVGDVSGDAMTDIVFGPGPTVARNDGAGRFRALSWLHSSDVNISGFVGDVDLADLDGDGSLDIFFANCCGGGSYGRSGGPTLWRPYNVVFLNDGRGNLLDTGQRLGDSGSHGVALGDFDSDGDVDAFVANGNTATTTTGSYTPTVPNVIWLNRGDGHFDDSGQRLGRAESLTVTVGDVDGDGDLDAVVGNNGADAIWLNDGLGNFSASSATLGTGLTEAVFLEDLDGDGDLDLFTAEETRGYTWLNDGSGGFTHTRQTLRYDARDAITLGDVNGDGHVDVFVAGINEYRVWLNEGDGRFE